jgi:hypothetical protein
MGLELAESSVGKLTATKAESKLMRHTFSDWQWSERKGDMNSVKKIKPTQTHPQGIHSPGSDFGSAKLSLEQPKPSLQ